MPVPQQADNVRTHERLHHTSAAPPLPGPGTAAAAALPSDLGGRYRLGRQLSHRPPVFLAYDLRLERPVTLTLLDTESGQGWVTPGHDRVTLASSLSHPALATLLDADDSPQARPPYLITDSFAAITLTELAAAHDVDIVSARSLATQLLAGLRYLHARGLRHDGLLADNVLVGRATDASGADVGSGPALRVQIGLCGITPRPQQVRRADDVGVDVVRGGADRQDDADLVWSLGTLLASLTSPAAEQQQGRHSRAAADGVAHHTGWLALIDRMLARDIELRPTAEQLSDIFRDGAFDVPASQPRFRRRLVRSRTVGPVQH